MLELTCYLIVKKKKNGWTSSLSARLSLTSPSLRPGEVAIKTFVKLPNALFEKPSLQATITVPDASVFKKDMDAQVLSNIEEIIAQQTGATIELRVVEPARNLED